MSSLETWEPQDTIPVLSQYLFPPYITLAHIFSAPKGWGIPPRTLNQCQLQYVVEGQANYTIEGEVFRTASGDLLFHGPNERHAVEMVNDDPYVCLSVVFHFGTTDIPMKQMFENRPYLGNYSGHPIQQLLVQIATWYRQPGQVNHLLCQGLLLQILATLALGQHHEERDESLRKKSMLKMALIRDYLIEHMDKDVRLAELEQVSKLSRNYIINQFKKTYWMTPVEYLGWLRVEKAKQLAIQTNLSYGEIAQMVGYADVHTLGRVFKNKTGVSLSQFCASILTQVPE